MAAAKKRKAATKPKPKPEAPPSFLAFVKPLVKLTPGQAELARVCFDGGEPSGEIGESLFGTLDPIPPDARHVVAICAGARAGKTYLGALRILHLAATVPLDVLGAGELAAAIIVAPDTRLARQALRYAVGAAKLLVPGWVENETADALTIRRGDGRSVVIEALPATRGGSAVRGRSLCGALADECAFLRDENSVVADVEIFRALAPRIVVGGQLLVASTPWTESGLLWSLMREHGRPRTCLPVLAPTTVLRDDARTWAMVERERVRDARNAEREFDAAFMRSAADQFFDGDAIEQAIDQELDAVSVEPGLVFGGLDVAFRRDSSALVLVRVEHGRAVVAQVEVYKPAKGQPLVPSKVCEAFARVARKHGVTSIMTDGHYVESVREHLARHGIAVREAPAGQTGKVETYQRARDILNEGRARFSRAHKSLREELAAVTQRPTSGGGLTIVQPRKQGSHGDVVSAWVLAMWSAHRHLRGTRTAVHVPFAYRPIDPLSARAQFGAPTSKRGEMELVVEGARVVMRPARAARGGLAFGGRGSFGGF